MAAPRAKARELPVLAFDDRAALETWLAAQPDEAAGIWLTLVKKGSGLAGVSRDDAVDAGLCHGWIDGQAKPLDDKAWLIRFTPRRSGSKWSQINCARADALIEAGRMTPRGSREIARAKQDGRWERAYAPPSTAQVPEDLARALDQDPKAAAAFASLDRQNRFAILHRVHDAKRLATRAGRIATFVAMLARGETIYPRKTPA